MRFKLGLAIGFGAGYVFGTKAGQERYEEIVEKARELRSTETARNLQSGVRDAVQKADLPEPVGQKLNTLLDLDGDDEGRSGNGKSSKGTSSTGSSSTGASSERTPGVPTASRAGGTGMAETPGGIPILGEPATAGTMPTGSDVPGTGQSPR